MTESSPAENAPCQPIPCEHSWQSHHVPGHTVYWVRVCYQCGQPDWDDLDREIAKKFGDTIKRIADEETKRNLAEIENAVRANERRRIRDLADRTRAVCTSEEGTSHYFSALLEDQAYASTTEPAGDEEAREEAEFLPDAASLDADFRENR